jgi:hypothetical protein
MKSVDDWVKRTARLGYIAVGCVYIIAGFLTAAAALGLGGRTASWRDAIDFVSGFPFGVIALIIIAAGLTGYGAWGVISGITDSDLRGRGWKGIALRVRAAASGTVHLVMAFSVVRLALTHRSSGSGSDENARHWTARLMDVAAGRLLVALIGVALVAYAVAALWRAWEAKLGERLHVPAKTKGREFLIAVCRFGIAARGVLFGVIGASLVQAAVHSNPSRTRATKGALQRVAEAPFGRWLLFAIAIGLAAYGLYAIIKGMYRRVEVHRERV